MDLGASNYGFLDLEYGYSDVAPEDLPFGEDEYNESESFKASVGMSTQYAFTNAIQAEMSLWYLGQAEVEGRSTYSFEDGRTAYTGGLSSDFYAAVLQLGYRKSLASFPCVWNVGISRFIERTHDARIFVGVNGNTLQAFDVDDSTRERAINHLALGFTMQLGTWKESVYKARWQHIQSFYGPIETLTIGLSF